MPDKSGHPSSSKAHGKMLKEKRAVKHAKQQAKLHPEVEDLKNSRH